jgi:hypothetical protein
MVAIDNIQAEQEITVMYDSGGYYNKGCGCEVCAKKDPRDLSPLRAKYKNRQSREPSGDSEQPREQAA